MEVFEQRLGNARPGQPRTHDRPQVSKIRKTELRAYEWLYGKWLPQSGEEPRNAPPIELYVNDPRTTPPDQLRTDVRLPLA